MPWTMPAMPPELLKVLGNSAAGNVPPDGVMPLNGRAPMGNPTQQLPGPLPTPQAPAAAPIQMGPGGVNLAPKDPNPAPFVNHGDGSMALPQDIMRSSLGPGQQKPASSDDPGITGQTPTPPDISQSPVAAAYKRYSDIAAQREAMQPPNRADYKPNWKDNLKGGLLAAAAGFGGGAQFGGQVGRNAINSKFNHAESDYNTKSSNLDKQLEIERGGLAAAKDVGELPQRDFENKMQVTREGREQKTAQSNADYKGDLADIRQSIADNNLDMAQKKLNEASQKNENDFNYHKQLLDLRKELLDQREKGGGSKTTSVGIENKKAQSLAKAKSQYDKETENAGNDPDLRKQADDNFKQSQQDAQDAYEAEIAANGGTPAHQDTSTWRGATPSPAAKPGQAKAGPSATVTDTVKTKATPKIGDVRTVKGGKKVRITKLFPDGTFNADPAD